MMPFWRVYNENQSCKLQTLPPPPQLLSACRSARHRRTVTRDTQTAPTDGRYKSATLPAVASS